MITISLSASQEAHSDSLVQIINSNKVDTIKIEAFLELAKITQTNKPDQSVDITINALEIAKNIMSERHIAKAYNQLGVSYYHKGELIQAKNFINNAYQLYRELGDKRGMAASLNGLGVLYYDQGELNDALDHFNKALEYHAEVDHKQGYATTLNNIGNVYKDLKDYDNAIEYYNKSIAAKEKLDDQHGIAMSINNLGLVYHLMGNYTKALEYHQKSFGLKKSINDKHGQAMSLHNIGWLYQAQQNYAAAMKYYQDALDMREILGDGYGASMTLGNMSVVQTELENYDKAIFYLNISLMKAEQIKAKKLLKEVYLQLSKIQVLANDYENAYINLSKYIQFTDSLMGEDKFKELSVLKAEMEAQNAENEINLLLKEREIQKLKAKRQEIISYSLSICIILLVLLGIAVYLRNKDRIKQVQLQEQMTKIAGLTDSYAIVTDIDDKIVWVNAGFTKLLGYTLSDVQGKTPGEVLRGSDTSKSTIEFIEEKKNSKEPFNAEILNYKKDGTPIWLTISATVVKNDKNEVDRFVSFGTDITRKKNAEKEIQRILA